MKFTLSLRSLYGLALRNLWTRKTRTLLTALGIVLGVAVILAINIANSSTLASINKIFDEASGLADLVIVPSSLTGQGFDESTFGRVKSIEGVQAAVPSVSASTLLAQDANSWAYSFSLGGTTSGNSLLLFGIDPAGDQQARQYNLIAGRFLQPSERSYSAVFTQDYADEKNIQVGKDVDILLPNGTATLRAVGIVKKDGPGLMNSGAVAFVPLSVVQDLFARGGELDQIDVVTSRDIGNSTQKLAVLRSALADKLGSKFLVNYPAQRGQIVTQQLATYQQGLSFFSMIALFVGGFLIYNAFTMTIVERTQEIGLLRALGVSRRQVLRLVMIEAALLGIVGSILGVIFGLIMAQGLIALMAAITATEIVTVSIPADGLFTALLVGLGVTLISSLLPAWRATRISPLAALRIKGQTDPAGAPRKLGFIAGAEFVIVGMLFVYAIPLRDSVVFQVGSLAVFVMLLGATLMVPVSLDVMEKFVKPIISRLFGREGMIGAGNIQRSRGRTSLTVAALMVGVSMVISIGAMSRSFQQDIDAWVDTSVGGDLIVRSPLHMQQDFGSHLAALPGVEAVTTGRYFGVRRAGQAADDLALVFQALDPQTYWDVASFQFSEDRDLIPQIKHDFANGGLLISTTVADHYKLERGDTLSLETRHGVKAFLVAGVVSDFTGQGYVIDGSLDVMRRDFGIDDVDRFVLKLAPGADLNAVKQTITDLYGKSRNLQVETTASFRARVRELTNRAFGLLDVLASIGVIVAALGVINTMMMNVLERRREIGALRSIGMTRRQIIRMILAEAGALGAIGAVFGIAFGILLSRVFVEGMKIMTGYRLEFSLPLTSLLLGLAIALIVSQAAALYPAWKGSRVNIVEAIKHE
ncbi:MAG TPA: FtsX-like permease family protein [Anaerolineae bacterium]|nr:FtsX-like permease family protein [Anaerolineae bacterium]